MKENSIDGYTANSIITKFSLDILITICIIL